jgi:hypothetical protein
MQKLSIQLYPTLISFKTAGKFGIPKAAVPSLALGLITSKLFILKKQAKLMFVYIIFRCSSR